VEAFPSRFEFYQYQAKKIKELVEREDVAAAREHFLFVAERYQQLADRLRPAKAS
jgi:hypothetical protein